MPLHNESWMDWNPGLNNNNLTLKEVFDTLPGVDPDSIDPVVKLFENPASPYALPGAVTLERHDCIHIMIGRGLLNQDEAFVIGYTMGTAKSCLENDQILLFKLLAKYIYVKPFKMTDKDLLAYDLAVDWGDKCNVNKIFEFPFENHMNDKIGELRQKIGINVPQLKSIYRKEKLLIPDSNSSKRLPS